MDDSQRPGCLGKGGRGTPDHFGVAERIDLITSTLGKALGGATGGRPPAVRNSLNFCGSAHGHIFFDSLPPVIAAAALKALTLVEQGEPVPA